MNKTAIVTTDILDEKSAALLKGIHGGMIAEMDTYYKSKSKAKVIPLAKAFNGKTYIRYPAVTLPVSDSLGGGFSLIPNYKKGDIVYLAPGMISTANALKGQAEIEFSRLHSLENMTVIGAFRRQPSEHNPDAVNEGIVIYHENGMKVILKDSSLLIECTDSAEIKSGSSSLKVVPSGVEINTGGTPQNTVIGPEFTSFMGDMLDLLSAFTVTCTAPGTPSSPPLNAAALIAMKARLPSLLTSSLKVSP